MPKYWIRGIEVDFPYDAYQVQLMYMERVIEALQEVLSPLIRDIEHSYFLCGRESMHSWNLQQAPAKLYVCYAPAWRGDRYGL